MSFTDRKVQPGSPAGKLVKQWHSIHFPRRIIVSVKRSPTHGGTLVKTYEPGSKALWSNFIPDVELYELQR